MFEYELICSKRQKKILDYDKILRNNLIKLNFELENLTKEIREIEGFYKNNK